MAPCTNLRRSDHCGPVQVLATLSGQWLALVASTAGPRHGRPDRGVNDLRRNDPHRHFLLISALECLPLEAWVLAGSDRVDTILYSRYIGLWSIPLAITGW